MRNSVQILNEENKPIGRITTEEPMPDLTRIFKDAHLIGNTGDFLLCAPVKENNLEMDCFLRSFDGHQFKHSAHDGQSTITHVFCIERTKNIKFTKDYRQIDVVAAHSPVAYGLGAVLKIDAEELYSQFKNQIKTISLYLGLLVLAGMAIYIGSLCHSFKH